MAKRRWKKRRYTAAGDRRGSRVKPHPNSLAAQDPSLLRLVDEDWRSLRSDEKEVARQSRYKEWRNEGKVRRPPAVGL